MTFQLCKMPKKLIMDYNVANEIIFDATLSQGVHTYWQPTRQKKALYCTFPHL